MLKEKYNQGFTAALEKVAGYDKATLALLRKAVTKAQAGDTSLISALKKLHVSPNAQLSAGVADDTAFKYLNNSKISALRTNMRDTRTGAFSNADDEFTRAFKEVNLEDATPRIGGRSKLPTDYSGGIPNYKRPSASADSRILR